MNQAQLAVRGLEIGREQRAKIEGLSLADLRAGSGGPLGKYTDFGSKPLAQRVAKHPLLDRHTAEKAGPDAESAYRLGRAYGALYHARQLLNAYGLFGRVASCGVRLVNRSEGVKVFRRPDRVHGRVGGVCMCGSSLACPVCAPRISGLRVGEIEQAVIRARHEGSRIYLLTLTTPHREGVNLLQEIRDWSLMYELATKGRNSAPFREFKRGDINAAEIVRSVASGWHFHRHLLVFSKNHVEPDFCAMKRQWRHAAQCLGRYRDGWEEHAFDVHEIFDGEEYVSKIGCELGSPLTKASRSIIWLLLADFEDPGRWGPDYVEAVWALQHAKVSALRWSRGLRLGLGLKEAKTDEEAAIETATETDELLGKLSTFQWEKVVLWNLEAELVQVAQDGRSSLDDFLVENGVGPLDSDFPTADVSTNEIQ